METQKTFLEHYQELPEPIRSKAISNFEKNPINDGVGVPDQGMLGYGFTWNKTHEGYDYWVNLHEQLNNGVAPKDLVEPVHLDKTPKVTPKNNPIQTL